MFSPRLPVGDSGCRHVDVGVRRGATVSHGTGPLMLRSGLILRAPVSDLLRGLMRHGGDGGNSSRAAAHGASSVVHARPHTVSSAALAAAGEVWRAVGERGVDGNRLMRSNCSVGPSQVVWRERRLSVCVYVGACTSAGVRGGSLPHHLVTFRLLSSACNFVLPFLPINLICHRLQLPT